MLAARYALMYPQATAALVLVNPIGLEDWKALGVPPLSIDEQIARESATNAERIRAYEQSTYYAGNGGRNMSAGSRCSPDSCRGPGKRSSRATWA